MNVTQLPQFEFRCASCGKSAALFTHIPAGLALEPGDQWRDRVRLRREGFMGTSIHFFPPEKMEAVLQALEQNDYSGIAREASPDLIGFHCWICHADYCQKCWDIGPPVFDDDMPGFYDCTYAVCPKEHQQIVDD